MTPAHQAALNIARDSFDMLRASVTELPDEALSWSPAEGMNSISVLVAHSLVATRFLFGLGCGVPRDFQTYRANERAEAFVDTAKTVKALLAELDGAFADLERLCAAGTEEDLMRESTTMDTAPGLQFLMHALAHLREHVGHAQALHDLWLAGFAQR